MPLTDSDLVTNPYGLSDQELYQKGQADDRGFPINPGGPNPTAPWQKFFVALDRQGANARAQGLNSRVDMSGVGQAPASAPTVARAKMPTASDSLGSRAGVDPGVDPVTAYQLGRAELTRRLEENQGLAEANRMQSLTNALSTDPGMIAAHASDAARQAETDAQARDTLAANEFERTTGLRRAQTAEDVDRTRQLAPYTPQGYAAATRAAELKDAAQARYAALAGSNDAKVRAAAISALARSSGASMPADEAGNRAATDALFQRAFPGQGPIQRPGAAAPAPDASSGGRVFPQSMLSQFAQEQNLSPTQAQQYIESHGYTVR